MKNENWFRFFQISNDVLGNGNLSAYESENWCAWTTFSRLHEDCGYWTSGLPNSGEYTETRVIDESNWGQIFLFCDIAHLIIPSQFFWESSPFETLRSGHKEQNIQMLSDLLTRENIDHRCSDLVLEIKLY